MYLRSRGLRHASWILPKMYIGDFYRFSGADINVIAGARLTDAWLNADSSIHRSLNSARAAGCLSQRTAFFRYSTVAEKRHELLSTVDFLSFIQSSLHQLRGPSHCWLNITPDRKNLFKGEGVLLVVVVEHFVGSLEANQNTVKMFENVKLLQQRNPFLQVMALQNSIPNDFSSHLLRIIKEYVTFPILFSYKNIFEEANVPCYIVSKGFQNPIIYPVEDVDLKDLDKAIHDLNVENGKVANPDGIKRTWLKPTEVVKEPDVCSASRNLLFSFPGCVSVDGNGDRFFLSDVNHHRIIVFNSNGNILDAIGFSPGFEDGEFEVAKLMRPAASFYNSSENCLYFVDSENHAIRRADMGRRVVETVFPLIDGSKKKGVWNWILDKIRMKRNTKPESEEADSESLLFPWHLLKSSDNQIFVLNQSFRTLWIVDLELGFIREVVKEPSKISDICGQMIIEKCTPLRQLPADLLQQQTDTSFSLEGIPYGGLMSSVATCRDDVVFCDSVGQAVIKLSKASGSATTLRLSNFGILGLPYWLTFSLEKVYSIDYPSELDLDHVQCFTLLPGRVAIELYVDIPEHTELVELPQEGCIWRQTRGAAADVSGLDEKAAISENAGIGQQFYDELDNLIFEDESNSEEESCKPPLEELPQGRFRIDCTINTSPGTSELIVNAALYLSLKRNPNSQDESQEQKAERIAGVLDPKREHRNDALIRLLTTPHRDLEDIVFVRPLHVKLKFDCGDHPIRHRSKEFVLTDSSVKVYVAL